MTAKSTAEPIPKVSRPAITLAAATANVRLRKEKEREKAKRALLCENADIEAVCADDRMEVELTGPHAKWMRHPDLKTLTLCLEAFFVVGLQLRPILDDAGGASHCRNRQQDYGSSDQTREHDVQLCSAGSSKECDREENRQANSEADPCCARVRQQQPHTEDAERRELRPSRDLKQSRTDHLFDEDQRGWHKEWPIDIGVLEKRLCAKAVLRRERIQRR